VSSGLPVAAGLIIIQSLDSAALFSTHVAFLFNCVRADLCYIMVSKTCRHPTTVLSSMRAEVYICSKQLLRSFPYVGYNMFC
jgi:hypothetical protein